MQAEKGQDSEAVRRRPLYVWDEVFHLHIGLYAVTSS